MEMTQANFRAFDKAFQEAVKGLEETFGVTIKQGGGSYSSTSFTSKLTVTTTEKVDGKDAEQVDFERLVSLYDEFTKDDYLKVVTIQGGKYELYGFNPKAPKNACKIRRIKDGRKFKCPIQTVTKVPKGFAHR